MKYDYLIVGAGLFGATLAQQLTEAGKKVLVVEREPYVGGMCWTENINGITVHKFGAHIFRTDSLALWQYVNKFCLFKPFINSPLAFANHTLYNLPFNMNTYKQLWGVTKPAEAKAIIERDLVTCNNPDNLEEYALSKVGKTIYETFIKGYTEKQWGRKCTELPPSILGRLPLRFTYDNNYYANKSYQGIPSCGYTEFITRLLDEADVIVSVGDKWERFKDDAKQVIYTGSIDEYFDFKYGELEYRSLEFRDYEKNVADEFGNAVINFPEPRLEFTRQIEHKHFLNELPNTKYTIISVEMPCEYNGYNKRYYPINTLNNYELYRKYSHIPTDTIFAGRLGKYQYTDMEQTILNAVYLAEQLLKGEK